MKQLAAALIGLFLLLGGTCPAIAEQDAKGGKDHPILSRMPDFYISEYKDSEFAAHKFIGSDKKPVSVEGHKYYIEYKLVKGASEPGELKIRRNIQEALKKIGGTVEFDDNFNRVSTIVVRKDAGETWIEVRSYNPMYRLTLVERQAMKQEVVADATALRSGLGASGHVPVYGIYFDTGKADIKPESDAAIAEIAKLLKGSGNLKVYIVGHTDNVGNFDANLKLSKDRAEAVSRNLTEKHGIAAARLKAHGVASLSPIASNGSEEGRAKNRRVELVEQ